MFTDDNTINNVSHMISMALKRIDVDMLDRVQASFLGLNSIFHPMLHLITLCHGLTVGLRLSTLNPNLRSMPLLQLFFSFLVHCIGGGTTVGMILGTPPKTFEVLNISTLIIVFFFLFVIPFDIVRKLLNKVLPLRALVKALANVSCVYCVFSGVDAALASNPNGWPLAILCGTIAATWGGVLSDLFSLHCHKWKFVTPEVLRHPSRRLLLPFLCSLIYVSTKVSHFQVLMVASGYETKQAWLLFQRFVKLIIGVVMMLNAIPSLVSSSTISKANIVPRYPSKKRKN